MSLRGRVRDPHEETPTERKRRHIEAAMRKKGRCTLCPPHAGENVTRRKYTSKPKRTS